MLTEKKDKYLFIIFLLIVPVFVFGQEDLYSTDTILHKEIKLQLPPNYKKDLFCYGEGCFLTYYFQDSTMVSVFSGGMQRLPLLHKDRGYYPCSTDTIENKISSYGIKDGKYWREDSYMNIRIYYDGVKIEKKEIFDNILNKFLFKNLN